MAAQSNGQPCTMRRFAVFVKHLLGVDKQCACLTNVLRREREREKYTYLIREDLVLIKFHAKILHCEFCDLINVMSIPTV